MGSKKLKRLTGFRISTVSHHFFDAAQRGYLEYLSLTKTLASMPTQDYTVELDEVIEPDPAIEELDRRHSITGIQTIVFAGMCFEAAIYDYAASYLGDRYVQEHLDKLGVSIVRLSLWQ